MDDDYVQLHLRTKTCWLLRGNCLEKYVSLYDSLKEFLGDSEKLQYLNDDDNKAMVFLFGGRFWTFECFKQRPSRQTKNSH